MASNSLLGSGFSPYIFQMDADQIANVGYLSLLGAALVGSYIAANKNNLGRVAQQATIWGLIFVGVIAAVGLWGDISRDVTNRQIMVNASTVEVPRSRDGHYYLTLKINGAPVDFVVDTGATQVVLSQDDARRIGIEPDALVYLGTANTANGTVRTASVSLDTVTLGEITDLGVRATVNGGQMDGSLLGMSYLGLYSRIAIESDVLILTR
jgi:aspartyl protease family protein